MNIRALAGSVAVVGFMLAAVGCNVDSQEPPATNEPSVASTTQALGNNGGGPAGYTCSPAGFCQCQGIADCQEMAYVCKRFWYCNDDAQGHRCACWVFLSASPPRPTPPPIGIGPSR